MNRLLLVLFLLVYFSIHSEGQINQVIYTDGDIDWGETKLSKTDQELVKKAVERSVRDYNEFMTLRDKTTGLPDQIYLDFFKDLFENNAKVINDFQRPGGRSMNYSEYAGLIFQKFDDENDQNIGSIKNKDKYFSASLISADFDKFRKVGQRYVAKVDAKKMVYKYINAQQDIISCVNGRTFSLEIYLNFEKSDLTQCKISKIGGGLSRECDDARITKDMEIGLGGNYHFLNANNILNGFDADQNFDLNSLPGINFHLGFLWSKPLNGQDKNYLSTGIALEYALSRTEVSGKFRANQNENLTYDYNTGTAAYNEEAFINTTSKRVIDYGSASVENHHQLNLNIPIGIQRLLKKGLDYKWYVGFYLLNKIRVYERINYDGSVKQLLDFDDSLIQGDQLIDVYNDANISSWNNGELSGTYSQSMTDYTFGFSFDLRRVTHLLQKQEFYYFGSIGFDLFNIALKDRASNDLFLLSRNDKGDEEIIDRSNGPISENILDSSFKNSLFFRIGVGFRNFGEAKSSR